MVIFAKTVSLMTQSNINWFSLIEDPYNILVLITLSYLFLHSFSGHKEFRFILPILPCACVLASHAISVFELKDSLTENNHAELENNYNLRTESSTPLGRQKLRQLRHVHMGETFFRSRRFLIGLSFFLNYSLLFYLCRFHQRASINVNEYISKNIQHDQTIRKSPLSTPLRASPDLYHIHYLVGCHSTPLHSHLHIRAFDSTNQIRINAWTLDCSPECRSDPNTICESDDFLRSPLDFFNRAYDLHGTNSTLRNHIFNQVVTCDEGGVSTYTGFCENTKKQPERVTYDMTSNKTRMYDFHTIPDVIVVDGDSYGFIRENIKVVGFEEKVFRQAAESIRIIGSVNEQAVGSLTFCFGICINISFETIWVLTRIRK